MNAYFVIIAIMEVFHGVAMIGSSGKLSSVYLSLTGEGFTDEVRLKLTFDGGI